MKTKILKIGAFCLALLLIAGIGVFANGLLGNPVSLILAKRSARRFLEEIHPGTDYRIERVAYDFKSTGYIARAVSPSSPDGDFSVSLNMGGKVVWDDYASRVTGHQNTYTRIEEEYRALTARLFDSPVYPYAVDICYGTFKTETDAPDADVPDPRTLENDKIYDIPALGRKAGELVLYIEDDTVSPERAAQILLETRRLCDEGGITFRTVYFVLETPKPEEGPRTEDSLILRSFGYDEITPEGLAGRVAAAAAETAAYYAEADKTE